jgi:hypothetical protein
MLGFIGRFGSARFASAGFVAGWLVVSISLSARADVVGAAPSSCPFGGVPSTCHGGPHCALAGCNSDAECGGGQSCRAVDVCVGVVNCAGLIGPGEDPSMYERATVEGACGACPADTVCQSAKLCAPNEQSPSTGGNGPSPTNGSGGASSPTNGSGGASSTSGDSKDDGGCSCNVGRRAGTGAPLLLAGGLLLAARAQRRRVVRRRAASAC